VDTIGAYPFGRLCLSGFYGDDDESGYIKPENCTACEQGMFCTAGREVSECAAGYVCNEEADKHTPDNEDLEDDLKAYACPFNYYCDEGTDLPTLCPTATYTFQKAAK
jgi:hypothetical protein